MEHTKEFSPEQRLFFFHPKKHPNAYYLPSDRQKKTKTYLTGVLQREESGIKKDGRVAVSSG